MPGNSLTPQTAPRSGATRPPHTARISLKALLATIAVGCVAGGYYANRFHQQRRVIQMVTHRGGQIGYERADAAPRIPPARLDRWLLRDIDEIVLFFAPVSDHDLAVLRHCRRLERLNLDYTSVGDQGLAHIAALSSLVQLGLKHTRVTDAGIHHLTRLAHLESLRLDGNPLTDSGLEQLITLPAIRYLSVRQTRVSPAAVERFRLAKPNCYVLK